MDDIERRAAALCVAPAGCAFLLHAEAAGLPPAEAARPVVAIHLAARGANEVRIWYGDHDDTVRAALAEGPRLLPYARAILAEPAAAWWFAPLDRSAQWSIAGKGAKFRYGPFEPPSSPPTRWERFAQKPEHAIWTSTATEGDCSLLAAIAEGAGDHDGVPPYERRRCHVAADARVLDIDSPEAWHDFAARYPALDDAGLLVPDWGLAARDWDGVHLSLGGLLTAEQFRVTGPAGTSEHQAWDAEQTAWLRWCFDEAEVLPSLAEPPEAQFRWGWPDALRVSR